MDHKEFKNSSLTVNVSDDTSKYAHSSSALPASKNKSYNDIGPGSISKVDASTVRPCAIIGPDRVLPHTSGDFHLKKPPLESWPYPENAYRQPPEYPTKPNEYHPTRNISPRQTFQENMQRIMVSPIYSSVKNSDESNLKNSKLNVPQEAKYCDVPYNINTVNNDHKSVRNSDIPMSSVNPSFNRSVPPYGWPTPVNIRPPKPYGAPEFYQYSEYANCGPRSMTMARPLRSHHEDTTSPAYPERLYQEANIRFKPYPPPKDKHQQMRYDYNNYQNTFHPPVPIPPHKYDLQKPLQSHPYPVYPQLKYFERRIHDPFAEGYQRPNQNNLNAPFHNQIIPPPYGPISGNCVQNKPFADITSKPMTVNKHLTFDSNNKIYLDLEPTRKAYPMPENIYYNDMNHVRSEMILPNHSSLNMHAMPQHQMYRRDNPHIKPYEYNIHYRNMDPSVNLNYSLQRLPLQFSPNAIAISPSDSNTSVDTIHTVNTSQEDCGYVSQSSTTSVRSLDSGHVLLPNDFYRQRESHGLLKHSSRITEHVSQNHKNKNNPSNKKNLNVRQFLQMWNEGEDEIHESTKDVSQIQANNLPVPSEQINNQEQLYVLGLVNVPSEELGKYEHIQKISKLPENIKGYNSIEILNQYEKLVESSNTNHHFIHKNSISKEHNFMSKRFDKEIPKLPRPVSPLDVEAKISQSVIHKEVGCNFEIKPCSPEMLNVEIAAPVQNVLEERIIEKVSNPTVCKSPMLSRNSGNKTPNAINDLTKIANCNMINNQYSLNNYPNLSKPNNYNVQDFNTSSGISLASLPRLDNDIELNFPEINQQFITANKIESEPVPAAKDLPRLDIEQVNLTQENNIFQQNLLPSPITFCQNVEKESSKLSKYRKNKKCELITKEESLSTKKEIRAPVHQRIDSVIIKNPDNIKLHENVNESSFPNIDGENFNNNRSEGDERSNPRTKTENDVCNLSFETAIDFSISKSDGEIPCEQIYDPLEKSNGLDSKCEDVFDQKDNITDDTQISDLNPIQDRESSQCSFEVNDYLQTKLVEESNVPVIKELSSEIDSSRVGEHSESKESDISVIRENIITSLEINQKELQEEFNIRKEIGNNKDTDSNHILNSDTYVNNENKFVHAENIDNLELELNAIAENASKDGDEDKGELQCNYISLQDENLGKNLTSSQNMENTILDHTNSLVKDENIVNSEESSITNKLVPVVVTANEESEKKTLPIDSNQLNQAETVPEHENLLHITKSGIEINEILPTIQESLNSQDSSKIFNDNEINVDIVPENKFKVTSPIQEDEKDVTLQIQREMHVVENYVNVENNENPNIVLCNTVIDRVQNDKLTDETTNLLITQDFLAKEISNEEILKSTESIRNVTKNNETEMEITKEETNYNFNDTNVSPCPQHSEVNPESLDVKTCNIETTNNLRQKIATGKIVPNLRVYKELYSPWMQKLHLFNEGHCKNVPFISKETLPESLKNSMQPVIIENTSEDTNDSSAGNNIPPCANNTNDNQGTVIVNSKITECNNDSLTVDFSNQLEENEKDNFLNSLCNHCPPVFQRKPLKRCLSESDLHDYKDDEELKSLTPNKRKKLDDSFIESHVISEDICNLIQNNRRNSVSTFYNDNSLYIVIDNDLIIAEGNEESDKIYISEMSEDLNLVESETIGHTDAPTTSELDLNDQVECVYSDSIYSTEKSLEESWVEDVACIETVISEDIIEDFEFHEESPKENDFSSKTCSDEPLIDFDSDNINKIKNIYGSTMSNDVLEKLRRTPQMDVNKTLLYNEYCNENEEISPNQLDNDVERDSISAELNFDVPSFHSSDIMDEKENIAENVEFDDLHVSRNIYSSTDEKHGCNTFLNEDSEGAKSYTMRLCLSPDENSVSNKNNSNYSYSSSPEVSSTTSEEKNSSILLKITNYNGSRMSQINEVTAGTVNKLSYKLTEKKEYQNYTSNFRSSRTLITKAAQKYIPPLKHTIRDLKVKLPLPEHRLNSLKQLKTSKVAPKIDDIVLKFNEKNVKQTIPKKQKPKFEDVLKSIDEIQFKKHKNKVKKSKNIIPKVIIKKNESGAHYASTNTLNNTEAYNPDLTGRKWQPWVFLEKNNFIDRMAAKNKIRAVYCHRKKTYVLAEKFKKYKSIYNANFVISQPNSGVSNKGNLKYTIRLKQI